MAKKILEKAEDNDQVQLSDMVLRNRVRLLIPRAIKTLSNLLNSENEAIRLKASQTLINKIMPDLRALSVENKQDIQGLVIVKHDTGSTVIDVTPIESHNKEQ